MADVKNTSRKRAMQPTQPNLTIDNDKKDQPPAKAQKPVPVVEPSDGIGGNPVVAENTLSDREKAMARHKRVLLVLPRVKKMCSDEAVGQFFKNIVDTIGTLSLEEQKWFRKNFGIDPQFSYERCMELREPFSAYETPRERTARLTAPIFPNDQDDRVQLNYDLLPLYKKIMSCFETPQSKIFVQRFEEAICNLDLEHIITFSQVLGIDVFKLGTWFHGTHICKLCTAGLETHVQSNNLDD